ncbi:MAG: hypothetical protein CMB80_06450 [Flammeovirgaceae bacterium]|nr:hypothetical protein [Flammeovirgaceae bacterium]HCX25072.1 hypothetical protein [Cytophagales bacterium]|tara:strand:- start:884 stop:1621 length:738 start_codon:yes stop_codon:yes gene_type:complete
MIAMKLFTPAFLIALTFFSSCRQEPKPTLVYPTDSTSQVEEQVLVKDTTLILTGELPIYFDSTNHLLFPIGPIKLTQRSSKIYFGSGSSGNSSFSIGYLSGNTFSGDLDNVMIQHLDSSTFRPLFEKEIKIRSFQFLKSIRKLTKQNWIVLSITDRDTNNDGKLDDEDIESLYVSDINGTNKVKLTPEFHELLDWQVLDVNKRLYFRTIEDSDRNGKFDKQDIIHHFYLQLDNLNDGVKEYFPLL